MTQMSSIVEARFGSRLLTSTPPLPVLLELERRRQQAARGAFGAKVDRRGPLALILQQRRLGVEHVQLRRSAHHEQHDVVLGLGREIGELRSGVPVGVAARACSSDSMPARPMEPSPPDSDAIQSRRESLFVLSVKSWPENHLVGCQQRLRVLRQRSLVQIAQRQVQFLRRRDRGRSASRYMSRILAGSVRLRRPRASTRSAARSCMKGLFMTNNCCSGEVVSSRCGAVIIGSGKS